MPGTWFMHWDGGDMEIEAVTFAKHPITGEMRLSDGAFRDAILELEDELEDDDLR